MFEKALIFSLGYLVGKFGPVKSYKWVKRQFNKLVLYFRSKKKKENK